MVGLRSAWAMWQGKFKVSLSCRTEHCQNKLNRFNDDIKLLAIKVTSETQRIPRVVFIEPCPLEVHCWNCLYCIYRNSYLVSG